MCLSDNSDNYLGIAENFNMELKIVDLIEVATGYQITPGADNYPQFLCIQCLQKLTTAYEVRKTCLQTQSSLKNDVRFIDDKSWFKKLDDPKKSLEIFDHLNPVVLLGRIDDDPELLEITGNSDASVSLDCDDCQRSFRSQAALDDHQKRVHDLLVEVQEKPSEESPGKISCEICLNTYSSLANLRRHKRTVHKNRKHIAVAEKKRGSAGNADGETGYFSCSICLKSFLTRSSMTSHKGHHAKARIRSLGSMQ